MILAHIDPTPIIAQISLPSVGMGLASIQLTVLVMGTRMDARPIPTEELRGRCTKLIRHRSRSRAIIKMNHVQ